MKARVRSHVWEEEAHAACASACGAGRGRRGRREGRPGACGDFAARMDRHAPRAGGAGGGEARQPGGNSVRCARGGGTGAARDRERSHGGGEARARRAIGWSIACGGRTRWARRWRRKLYLQRRRASDSCWRKRSGERLSARAGVKVVHDGRRCPPQRTPREIWQDDAARLCTDHEEQLLERDRSRAATNHPRTREPFNLGS